MNCSVIEEAIVKGFYSSFIWAMAEQAEQKCMERPHIVDAVVALLFMPPAPRSCGSVWKILSREVLARKRRIYINAAIN